MALRLCPCATSMRFFILLLLFFIFFLNMVYTQMTGQDNSLFHCLGLRLVLWWVVQSGSDDARAFLIIIFESSEHAARFAMPLLNPETASRQIQTSVLQLSGVILYSGYRHFPWVEFLLQSNTQQQIWRTHSSRLRFNFYSIGWLLRSS